MNLNFTRSKTFPLFAFLLLLLSGPLSAQPANDYNQSVELEATIDPDVPSILLHWQPDADAGSFNVYRRVPGSTTWGPVLEALPGSAEEYLDIDVEVGELYEYRVTRGGASGLGYGYVYAGIEIPETDYRGRLLVVVDDTHEAALAAELEILYEDFRADGWEVQSISVSPTDAVPDVKAEIQNWYDFAPDISEAVLLFGRIPVPYSGLIYPDGHTDHNGAWPADVYYGDMDGNWTDVSVDNTSANQERHHNVPGDGKFDNSVIASDLELQVGRVDFFNMPAFAESEEELLRQYIYKNHDFKHRVFNPVRRGLIENNFAGFAEGFGQNGLKNFTAMFGRDSVFYIDYSTLYEESYLWSYGCGGGSYSSASGIGNTATFASDSLQTVFTMLFGSYFGDWDSANNFLRAALATGTTLSNAWAARPNWEFHPMAMGFTTGYCAQLTQNNTGFSYNPGFGNRQIHVALMGDPTLRMHMVAPPESVAIAEVNGHAQLSWSAPDDDLVGYHIYRKLPVQQIYSRLTDLPVQELTYVDSCLTLGETYEYYVKSVKLESSASGSYFNQSLGVGGSLEITIDNSASAAFEIVQTGPFDYTFENNSVNASGYLWEFGDGDFSTEFEPTHFFGQIGDFEITLIAYGDCDSSVVSQTITITSLEEVVSELGMKVFPNPVLDLLMLECAHCTGEERLSIRSAEGRILKSVPASSVLRSGIPMTDLPSGMYWLQVTSASGTGALPVIKE